MKIYKGQWDHPKEKAFGFTVGYGGEGYYFDIVFWKYYFQVCQDKEYNE